jgi:hypothetical protein
MEQLYFDEKEKRKPVYVVKHFKQVVRELLACTRSPRPFGKTPKGLRDLVGNAGRVVEAFLLKAHIKVETVGPFTHCIARCLY